MSQYLMSRNMTFEDFIVGDSFSGYHLWKRNFWPMRELEIGDNILYFSRINREVQLITEVTLRP